MSNQPNTNHPITIRKHPARVIVRVGGQTIADTQNALALREASYPVVLYVPREDVNMALLERSSHATHCPYKGDASYYSIPVGGRRAANAVWTYEAPLPLVAEIKNHMAFYPDRIDEIIEQPLG